jgi:hypothetical protein
VWLLTSIYDTAPLRETLAELVDPRRLDDDRRGEQPGLQLVHPGVAEGGQRPVDRGGQPRRGHRGRHGEFAPPQGVQGVDRVVRGTAEHRGGDRADRNAGNGHRPESGARLVEGLEHAVLVGAERAAAL